MRIHCHTIRRLTIIVLLPINLLINMPTPSTGSDGDCIQHIVPCPFYQQYTGTATTNQHNSVVDDDAEQCKLSIVDGSKNPSAAAVTALQCQEKIQLSRCQPRRSVAVHAAKAIDGNRANKKIGQVFAALLGGQHHHWLICALLRQIHYRLDLRRIPRFNGQPHKHS